MIKKFIENKISIKEFMEWAWDKETEEVYHIKLLLAEYSNGHRTKEELSNLLKEYYANLRSRS